MSSEHRILTQDSPGNAILPLTRRHHTMIAGGDNVVLEYTVYSTLDWRQ